MTKNTRYLGLDVHGETITAAVAVGRAAPESLGQFRNSPESVRKFFDKLGDRRELKVCYEAATRQGRPATRCTGSSPSSASSAR
jgi:transposase